VWVNRLIPNPFITPCQQAVVNLVSMGYPSRNCRTAEEFWIVWMGQYYQDRLLLFPLLWVSSLDFVRHGAALSFYDLLVRCVVDRQSPVELLV
ncbi:hypothetical protein MD536_21260, partial [Flavihumibacter cheonanensis]